MYLLSLFKVEKYFNLSANVKIKYKTKKEKMLNRTKVFHLSNHCIKYIITCCWRI